MLLKTHKIVNVTLATSIVIEQQIPLMRAIPAIICVAIGTALPDIDEESSKMGRRFPFISKRLTHRGITHSIYPILALLAACYYIPNIYIIGLTFGYILHIIEDMFSKDGLNILFPNHESIKLPLSYRVGGGFETIIRKFAWVYMVILILTIR